MEMEQVRAAGLVVGDVVGNLDKPGWWSVTEVRTASGGTLHLTLRGIDAEEVWELQLAADRPVWRSDPATVHHKDEFLGLTADQAEAWAAALGWEFNNRSLTGVLFTDDEHRSRINVWLGPQDTVVRTRMG